MKRLLAGLVATTGVLLASPAFAGWHTVVIKNMYIVIDPAASDPGPRVMVTGTFTPALPCSLQYFVLLPGDLMFKEVYAMLLTAQTTGNPVQYNHVYCHASGLSRGSNYITAPD